MKNTKTFLTVVCCLFGLLSTSRTSAQNIDQLEKSIQSIEVDLQQKTLELSWKVTEEYLTFCNTFNKMINITSDDYLRVLTYEKKPKEIAPEEKSYKKAKATLEAHMKTYKEYASLDSLRKSATSEASRKDAGAAMSTFYTRLWNEDEKYQELRNNEQIALKQYRIAAVRYMLNEYKAMKRVMPTKFIDYAERENILANNPDLRRLSQEVRQLEEMQRQTIRDYQKLKYNIDTDKPKE